MFQYTPYILPLFFSASIILALTIYAWQFRPRAAALSFAALMLAGFVWVFFAALEFAGVELEAKLFWANVKFIGITALPVAWLALALSYTGRQRYLKRLIPLFLVIPIITNILLWSNDFHHLWRGHSTLDTTSGPFPIVVYDYGPWFYWVHVPFGQFTILISIVILLRSALLATAAYRKQILALLFSLILPLLVDILYVIGFSPIPKFNLTPVVFGVTGIIIGWDLFRYRFLDVMPVARDKVIESMGDGVIVLDTQARIVDMNPAAQQLTRRSLTEVVGQPLEQILSRWPDLAERFGDVLEASAQIALGEDPDLRYYDLRISPLYGRRKKLTGRLIVLRDISERKQAEEALQASEDRVRSTLSSIDDLVFVLDEEGVFVDYYQPENVSDLYVPPEAFFGKSFAEVMPLNVAQPTEEAIEAIKATGIPQQFDYSIRLSEQEEWFSVKISARWGASDKFAGVTAVVRNITERKEAEESIQRAHRTVGGER